MSNLNSQVTNSKTISKFFRTNTTSVISKTVSLPHYSKPFATSILPSKPSVSYLEDEELSIDFAELTISTSLAPTPTNTLFGNVTAESTQPSNSIINNSINAYICIYSINETSIPFFEYLFTCNEDSKEAEFPKITIDLQTSPANNEDDDSNIFIKTQIMNQCIEYIKDIFKIPNEIINTDFLNEIFKGFILKSETIYLFFNGTSFDYTNILSIIKDENQEEEKHNQENQEEETSTTTPPLFKKAILDEIINKCSIGETTILPEIVELFKENNSINTLCIKDNYNSLKKIPVIYPLCLYLCKNEETDTEQDKINWTNVSIDDTTVKRTVNFSLLGDFYYFSSTLLAKDQTEDQTKTKWKKDEYKKYAVFLDINNGEYPIEESYIVKDLTSINKEQLDTYFQKLNPANISTIWFKYSGLQLWAIKYPTQVICINSI